MESRDWDKIAQTYHQEIVSPFQKGVKNPLFSELKKIKGKNKVIADIGCGRGEIIDTLAEQFKQVYASDFSKEMIEIAKTNTQATNVSFEVQDMRTMTHKNEFDVITSTNSVLLPSIPDIILSLSNLKKALKKNGILFGIFPSMEAVLYHGMLLLDDELQNSHQKSALAKAKKRMEEHKYDFVLGTFDEGGEVQKFYYQFELEMRLHDAGFKEIEISKVEYPWGRATGYDDFPNKPGIWDWFVKAK